MADVWDPQWYGSTKTLDVHVSSLRAKLHAAAQESNVSAPTIVAVRAARGHPWAVNKLTVNALMAAFAKNHAIVDVTADRTAIT